MSPELHGTPDDGLIELLESLGGLGQRQEVVIERRLRVRVVQSKPSQPGVVCLGPVLLAPIESQIAAQEELRHAVSSASLVFLRVFPRTTQVSQRLIFGARRPHLRQQVSPQHLTEHTGISPIGLDAVSRLPRNQRRRDHHARDAGESIEPSGETVPRGTRLVADRDRAPAVAAQLAHHPGDRPVLVLEAPLNRATAL